MDRCSKNLDVLDKHIQSIKATNSSRLQEEYEKLLQGLKRVEDARADENAWANPGTFKLFNIDPLFPAEATNLSIVIFPKNLKNYAF
jgi:hypothetical protein